MKPSTYVICMVCLVTLISTCFFVLITFDPISWIMVYEQTDLKPGSLSYTQWEEPSIHIYFQTYFFNLTNPEEFVRGGKPRVNQVGPYTYREHRKKINIRENLGGQTVQYDEVIYYYFDREKSVGPETDIITTVNLAYIQIDVQFGWLPSIVDQVIELLENRTQDFFIVRLSISELLWGYEDAFLRFLSNLFIPVPSTMIGLYLNRNGTAGGKMEIYRNNKDPSTYGHVYKYRGQDRLSVWTTRQANQLNGSDGSLFHPYMKWTEQPYIYSADVCRSIQLRAVTETKHSDVPVYRYLPFEDTFKSPLTTEKNRGFCIHWPNCLKDNVHDMTTCMPGAPIVMSLPHLMHADPEYQNAVKGLQPSEDLNTSFLIEPKTGVVFKAEKKLQINARVRNNPKFTELSLVKDVFLPIMFMNESFIIDSTTASGIRNSLYITPIITKTVLSIFLIIGTVLLILIIVRKYRYGNNGTSDVPYEGLQSHSETITEDVV